MTQAEYENEVKERVPFDFTGSFLDIQNKLTGCLKRALKMTLSKYEKFETIEITGSTKIERATAVVKCRPSTSVSNPLSVFSYMHIPGQSKFDYYFSPERMLMIPEGASAYVELVVDPAYLSIEDLSLTYQEKLIELAVGHCLVQEGTLGSYSKLSDVNIEYNFEQMKEDGKEIINNLEQWLKDNYFGLYGSKG
jgi:hypothetical protein